MKTCILISAFIFSTLCNSTTQAQSPGGVSTGLRLWLKANKGVNTTGSLVNDWTDQSGNGFIATTNGPSPILSGAFANFNPGVRFNKTFYQSLRINGGIIGSTETWNDMYVFVVFSNVASGGGVQTLFYNDVSTGNFSLTYDQTNNSATWVAGSTSTNRISASLPTSNGSFLLSLAASTTSTHVGSKQNIFWNGAQVGSDNDMSSFSGVSSNLLLGMNPNLFSAYCNGQISELIVYNRTLTSSEFNKIQSYLAVKYGLSLNQTPATNYTASDGTSIIWNGNAYPSFNNEITCIGRNDESELDQRQSTSLAGRSILTVRNGFSITLPSSDPNDFANDLSFFTTSATNSDINTQGETDYGTTVNGEKIMGRIAKRWVVQESPSMGTVHLQFNLGNSGFGSLSNNFFDVRLLVDADGTFASGATSVFFVGFDNRTQVVDFNFDFTSSTGYYFTLGTLNLLSAPLPVELTNLKYDCGKNGTFLKWSTASELNNKKFVVEGSADGSNWIEIDSLDGKGTSKEKNDYAVQIQNSYFLYLRIKQVDFDNTANYSEIVAVNCPSSDTQIDIFPNPAVGQEYLTIHIPQENGKADVDLISMQGQSIMKASIELRNQSARLEIPDVTEGLYLLKIYNENGIEFKKRIQIKK